MTGAPLCLTLMLQVDEALVQATAANSASGPAAPEKLKTKHVEKAKAKEREAKAAAERAASAAAEEDKPLEDPVAEAKRRERLQLAADMALAREALGGGPSTAGGAGSASSSGGGGALPGDVDLLVAAMTLTSKEHFTQLAQKTVARVLEAGGNKSTFLVQYVREVLNAAAEKLSVDELKALSTVTDAARNAKLEAAKAEQKKKKAPAKKPTKLAMEKDTDYGECAAADSVACVPCGAAASPALLRSFPRLQTTTNTMTATWAAAQRQAAATAATWPCPWLRRVWALAALAAAARRRRRQAQAKEGQRASLSASSSKRRTTSCEPHART